MRVAVFGASGPTGREVVKRAVALGHQVTAFVRNPAAMSDLDGAPRIVQGDARDPAAVAEAVKSQDAVVCCIGPRNRASRSQPAATTVASEATRNIVLAMGESGVRRLVVQSSIGVGESRGRSSFLLDRILIPFFLRKQFADKELQERIVRESDLDWVIVQPVRLVDRPARGRCRVFLGDERAKGTIPRADVAVFLLQQLSDRTYLGRAPRIGA